MHILILHNSVSLYARTRILFNSPYCGSFATNVSGSPKQAWACLDSTPSIPKTSASTLASLCSQFFCLFLVLHDHLQLKMRFFIFALYCSQAYAAFIPQASWPRLKQTTRDAVVQRGQNLAKRATSSGTASCSATLGSDACTASGGSFYAGCITSLCCCEGSSESSRY